MEIKKVGVLGCGLMGSGIAQTAASAGFETTVREVTEELCRLKSLWKNSPRRGRSPLNSKKRRAIVCLARLHSPT